MQVSTIECTDVLDKILEDLIRFQRETISEQRIIDYSEPILERLDEQFKANPSLFTEQHIEQIDHIKQIISHLDDFQSVLEDMTSLNDFDEYHELMETLTQLAGVFEGYAVAKRIAKETRELFGKRMGLSVTARSKTLTRIEREAPKCRFGHRMTLRQKDDWFWGCSTFPNCRQVKKLTDKHATELARF